MNRYKISFFILILILISTSIFLVYNYFWNFVNSSFFVALMTTIVGGAAIFLYIKQKIDFKRDAASILLMEIRHAEEIIKQVKSSSINPYESIVALLPTNNWVKYNYLFIKDLDRDELDLINNFYNQCLRIDDALLQVNISKQIEAKSNYIQSALVQIAKDSSSKSEFDNKKNAFLGIIQDDPYAFNPNLPSNTIAKGFNFIAIITTSTAGEKLKRIAKMR